MTVSKWTYFDFWMNYRFLICIMTGHQWTLISLTVAWWTHEGGVCPAVDVDECDTAGEGRVKTCFRIGGLRITWPLDGDAGLVFRSAHFAKYFTILSVKFESLCIRPIMSTKADKRRSEKGDWAIANEEKIQRFSHLQWRAGQCYC